LCGRPTIRINQSEMYTIITIYRAPYTRFFSTWTRQYSCAYFKKGTENLDEAQLAKKRHIATKLCLAPGQRVLDIGCGWGGLSLHLAKEAGAEVLGITLSDEQERYASARARNAGTTAVSFRVLDYRTLEETFDRIVSVGMFEQVGLPNYPTFFQKVNACLRDDGIALLHTIGRLSGPGVHKSLYRQIHFSRRLRSRP